MDNSQMPLSSGGEGSNATQKDSIEEGLCRVCLTESEPGNPLVVSCKCMGSLKFIHIKCLQQWLQNRLHCKTTAISISFVWKTFKCEICNEAYPSKNPNRLPLESIQYNDVSFDTVIFPKKEAPYIIIEILSRSFNQIKGSLESD